MAGYDQPLAFSMLLVFFILIALLISNKLDTVKFTAVSILVLVLFFYFSVGYRITEMSLASGTIKLASDQAQKYASEIKDIRDRVLQESKFVSKIIENEKKTDQIVAQISDKSLLASQKLTSISEKVLKSESIFQDLQKESDFESKVSAAQSDDRQAFDSLKTLASDPNYIYHAKASFAWKAIRTQSNTISSMRATYKINWSPNFDPNKLGIEALSHQFFQAERDPTGAEFELRSALIDYISSRQDFSKDKRLDFLLKVIHLTGSTKILASAALNFNQLAEFKSGDLTDVSSYDKWWSLHPHEQ